MTAITYYIEDYLPAASSVEKEAMERMLNTNKLDEIYAIAHDQLGEHDEAAKLRQWMVDQASKRKSEIRL